MKKHLLSLFAMASMVFASSCTSEEIVSQSTGNEVAVTFTAHVRNDVKSRAVGDDTDGIDQLVFAVYDENQELLPLTQEISLSDANNTTDGKKKVEIKVVLVKGQTYSFAFWAQDKDYSAYTFTPKTKTVSINYPQDANQKFADAFFANYCNYTVTGSFEKEITLKRPFAQVNFLTTQADFDNAKNAGFEPDKSGIVVANAATSLNVLTGEVGGDVSATFNLAQLIEKNENTTIYQSNTTTPITLGLGNTPTEFRYLATAYFLPTEATAETTITASMSAVQTNKSSKAPVELKAEGIKARRNFRTNIYGNLLTSNGLFKVTIDPAFDGDYSQELEDPTTIVVATVDEANALFANGETNVTIQEAPTSPKTIYLPATNDNITINFDFEENTTPDNITIEYQAGATEKPANIEVNGDAGGLIINAPQSTVTLNGSYESVVSTTANNTLIVPKGVTIGTLTLKQGNAKIYYGVVETIINEGKVAITWLVDSKEQLEALVYDEQVRNAGAKIELISDIDMTGSSIEKPIHFWNRHTIVDGNNHTISNLTMSTTSTAKVPLGLFSGTADIKNIKFDKANISGYSYVAVVAGNIYGNIENCHVSNSSVTCTYWMAGAMSAQYNNGNVKDCSVTNTTVTGPAAVGALVGNINETKGERKIENCEVSNCTIVQNGSFGGNYDLMFGAAVGFINISNSTVLFTGCKVENTTVKGVESNTLYGSVVADTKVIIDGTLNVVVDCEDSFKEVITTAGSAGAGNTVITITKDLDFTNMEWKPIKVDGYHGADIVTLDGNGAVIKGLKAPLFAGGFAGGSGIVIKNLTIDDSNIVSTNTIGSGAFIESIDSMDKIWLENCHVKNSTITGGQGSRTGGLIGWTAGYNNENDGPVKTYVTIKNCSVIDCTITCDGSVGGLYGHAGNNAWTYSTVEDCTVEGCTLKSTDDGEWRVGVVVGTANVGEMTISGITENNNTLEQTNKVAPTGQSNLYGRFVPGTTGKLKIDGIEIK